jgi:hypothetical protein
MGWARERSEFESRKAKEYSLLRIVQTGSGVHLTSHPLDKGVLSPEVKRQGRETDYSH